MLPAAYTTTRGPLMVNASALEVKWSFKAIKECSSLTFNSFRGFITWKSKQKVIPKANYYKDREKKSYFSLLHIHFLPGGGLVSHTSSNTAMYRQRLTAHGLS